MLIDLDDAACRDPRRVGAKAAALAQARAAGLPALPGAVVPGEYARPALRVGEQQARDSGSGAARLAVMKVLPDGAVVEALAERAELFPAIVRSSSELDGDAAWAGAFSSFDQIGPAELGTAIRGVWASVFSVDVLERCDQDGRDPAQVAMGVLVQPQITPECGGTATVRAGGVVVVATDGSLSALTSGWDAGSTAIVTADGQINGEDAVQRFGAMPLLAAATLAGACRRKLGHDTVEWALSGGDVILLQSGSAGVAEATDPADRRPAVAGVTGDLGIRLARAAIAWPGQLGDQLVLPWFAASGLEIGSAASPPSRRPLDDLDVAVVLAAELTKQAWCGEDPATTVRALLGPDARAALDRLGELEPVDDAAAGRLVSLLAGVAAAVAERGWVAGPAAAWRLSADDLRARLAGQRTARVPVRPGPDRWEPFVYGMVAAAGQAALGTAAAPGVAAGPVVVVDDPSDPPLLCGREVLVADVPVPRLAPLLWSASALVTTAGNPGAHLVGVARSVGVPAVVSARLEGLRDLFGGPGAIAAVDGSRGSVSFLKADG